MTPSCIGCANSGELRDMIEQVVEKTAKQAAENVQRDIKIEILKLEKSLEESISKKFESKLSEHFGMTPQEHAIEHDRMKNFYSMWNGMTKSLFKKIAISVVIIALSVSGIKMIDLKAVVSQKPDVSKDRRINNETN